ncbi:MAG: protein translocase subunit SecD [Lachnospiraceae bacterium]|jgi:SecD/SecF fusion protein|nr:protein translocase subunit SecD [Lachnospiraceae bacterium]
MKQSKTKSAIVLVILLALLALFGYTAAFGWGETKSGSGEDIKLGLDLEGGVSITYQVVGEEEPSAADMSDTIYKLQKRVEGYSTEAQVYQEGSDRISIEIPGVADANEILSELGRPGSLEFYDVNGELVLEGTDVVDAQAGSRQNDMGNVDYEVRLTLTDEGAEKFSEATKAAAPNHDPIFIVYDNAIISYPAVQQQITDGNCVITNMESFEAAENLASTIRIGGLTLTLEELRSNVVGAQLGSDAIRTALIAGAVGFAIIAVFMIAVYFLPGFAAVLALGMYVELVVILLGSFGITLTLPGIAGIILGIGMAVDANVIIFARIREELATGKTVASSVKIGFNKALSAIIDGNITTLIAAIVLGLRGTGPIKGFAQTLALGIILSMFTAVFITRIILNALIGLGLDSVKLFGVAKEKKSINFLGKKHFFFGISVAVILVGFVVMGVQKGSGSGALNYSLDFMGGTQTTVTFAEDYSIERLDAEVVPGIEDITGDANVQVQKVAGSNQVIFKTRTLEVEEREALDSMLEENFELDDAYPITAETISSTISSEAQTDAVVAVAIATVCMLLYIWFRFKDIRFGASAVIALIHDVLVVLAFYAVTRVSVGSTFIACMLTIVGYSINATIVIFDRVRENMRSMTRKDDLQEMVNHSITQTLSRSIFTSLTTFIMVTALYVFGVSSIREFALPLMAGILCGTYSSVCITGALWYVLRTKIKQKEEAK